jgi:putative transposase
VIGYPVYTSLDTTLVLEVFKMAIARRRLGSGVIHHSDNDVQCASDDYLDEPEGHGFLVSIVRAGNPYKSAMMESLFKTMKYEEVCLCEHETLKDVVARLLYFIEVHNQKRLHSALSFRSPDDFKELLLNQEGSEIPRKTLLNLSLQS